MEEVLKKGARIKHRDIVFETVLEYSRRSSELLRIYPAPNSKLYDKYFPTNRSPINKIVYKALFSNDLLHYGD